MNTEEEQFLAEYEKLCKKYRIIVSSCSCCESPWIWKVEGDQFETEEEILEKHIKHLKKIEDDDDES